MADVNSANKASRGNGSRSRQRRECSSANVNAPHRTERQRLSCESVWMPSGGCQRIEKGLARPEIASPFVFSRDPYHGAATMNALAGRSSHAAMRMASRMPIAKRAVRTPVSWCDGSAAPAPEPATSNRAICDWNRARRTEQADSNAAGGRRRGARHRPERAAK